MLDVDVVVIGSGAGGLAAALACARAGQKVLVVEQHYLPGGWCHSFPLGGFQFSPGVHYIGGLEEGGMMREVYEGLGVAKHLTFLELNPDGYDHVQIGDDFHFDLPKGFDALKQRLKDRFPHEAKGIDGYLDTLRTVDRELKAGMGRNRKRDLITLPFRSPNLVRWGLRPLSSLLDAHISDPYLRAVLTIQVGDHGLGPRRAPVALHASVAAHYFEGGWYPKGGAAALPRAFQRELKRHGGEIRLSTEVKRITTVDEGGRRRATGVVLGDGTEVRAKHVISNADPEITFRQLVGVDHVSPKLQRRLKKTKWSLSNVSLFLAADMDLEAMGYDSGNYWYNRTPDIDRSYDLAEAGTGLTAEEYEGLFVTITTLKDPTKRVGNVHTLEAFNLVTPKAFQKWFGTYGHRPEDYADLKARLKDSMFTTAERIIPGLRDATVFSDIGTPATNRYFVRSFDGNMYGTEKSAWQVGPWAFPIRTEIDNLLLCGASTIGHGVAGATMSGLVAAAKVLRCPLDQILTDRDHLTLLPADDLSAWPEKERERALSKRSKSLGRAHEVQPGV